jgi:hypothetical protein
VHVASALDRKCEEFITTDKQAAKLGKMMRGELEDEDRVKLETWFYTMNLLEHYRALAFEPMYQRGLRFWSSAEDKELRANKIEIIRKNHNKLIDKWEKALGPSWRDVLEQD